MKRLQYDWSKGEREMSQDGGILCIKDRIEFHGSFRPWDLPVVNSALWSMLENKPDQLVLDFRKCTNAFPNSMLPLIASISRFRRLGYSILTVLPEAPTTKDRFISTNWAHLLAPKQFAASDEVTERHLVATQYSTFNEHARIIKLIVDVILRNVIATRNSVSALEWSLLEIMDNVLNHANSPDGGFVQMGVFTNTRRFAFCVVDSGKGIKESLSEKYKTLQSDRAAIEMAVRAGVTRNEDVGQGNGLSGSLNLAIRTDGWFRVVSGTASVEWKDGQIEKREHSQKESYFGTVVDIQIPYDKDFDLAQILNESTSTPNFAEPNYTPSDFLDERYTTEDGKYMIIKMLDETVGFGTRIGGNEIRTKSLNLLDANKSMPLIVDWNGIPVISSSFADEFIGKLFIGLGPMTFMARVVNRNMMTVVRAIIDRAILQRTRQALGGTPIDEDIE
jgi:anti-sigma regulatory factor (Ser/Thr protein kinase)